MNGVFTTLQRLERYWYSLKIVIYAVCIDTEICFYRSQFLITNWKTVPTFNLWSVDVENNPSIYWAFVISHGFAWSVICGGCILYDLPELLGVSQVYNDITNCLPPIAYKSTELRRLISRIRHPSFLALTVVLWVFNLMRYIVDFYQT